eukprot:9492040-Pyramimonas_sp.AAC.1
MSTLSDSCHFGDISNFWVPELQPTIEALRDRSGDAVEQLQEAILSGRSVRIKGRCLTHTRMCFLKTAFVHVAGTPCPDWSQYGDGDGARGKTIVDTLCWCALRRKLQEAVVVQENVRGFDVTLLRVLLGDLYEIDSDFVGDAFDFGWPAHRVRRCTVMRHKSFTMPPVVPLPTFMLRLHRPCRVDFHAFLFADDAELQDELDWATSRPSVQAERAAAGDTDRLTPGMAGAFRRALSATEKRWLEGYEAEYGAGGSYQLNQNPLSGFGSHNRDDGGLRAILKRAGITWCHFRWLTPTEVLASQGFPVFPFECAPRARCSFNFVRRGRMRDTMKAQSGNAMNAAVVGGVLMHALLMPVTPEFETMCRMRMICRSAVC